MSSERRPQKLRLRGCLRFLASAAALALIVAAVFVAFLPALSGEFQEGWDDNYTITENGHFRGLGWEQIQWMFTTDRLGHWQPLSWVSFAINYELSGLDPFAYHLTNVLLHAANAVLFFFLCRAFLRVPGALSSTGDLERAQLAGSAILAPLAGALIFAVHPLRVESVAWVTERRDVLSAFFLLLAMLPWLRYCARAGAGWYLLALAAFALSLLSKAWGITLPAVLLVLDVWPLKRLKKLGAARLVLEKLPFLAFAAFAAVMAFWAQRASGAMHYAEHFTPLQKAAQACYGLCFYVVKSLWPVDLLPAYLLERRLDWTEPRFLASFAAVAAGVAAAIRLKKRLPAVTAALLCYAIIVSPVLGLTQSGVQLVADRYTYLATMPFALLAAGGLASLRSADLRTAATVGWSVAALVLAFLTWGYSRVWKNSDVLWQYTLEKDPGHSLALNQLGTQHMKRGDDKRATECYEQAIRANPESHLAFENRGIMRVRAHDEAGALADWERAIELNPHCAIPIVNRGTLKFQSGDYRGALADYLLALELEEDQPGVWYMLGSTRYKLADYAGAAEALERSLSMSAPKTPLHDQATKLLNSLPVSHVPRQP